MKMVCNCAYPIAEKDYPGLAEHLRHEAMSKPHVQRILKADPKFAAYFRSKK